MATIMESCSGRIEPHHVTGRGMGASRRDDRDVVPLCSVHHRAQHNSGFADTKDELLCFAHVIFKEYLDQVVIPSQIVESDADEECF